MDLEQMMEKTPVLADIRAQQETLWENQEVCSFEAAKSKLPLRRSDIDDAEARLGRFAPFIMRRFPETAPWNGIIESPLTEIPEMKEILNEKYEAGITGRLFLKRDSDLAVSGSVKARGGIYEVLKHSEDLALKYGILGEDYTVFDTDRSHDFFRQFSIHVGSTGNLGLSIGIISEAIGYRVTIHMSEDAKEWKKNLLRSRGVTVIEYASDYSSAVREGRETAAQDEKSYFVDDENSTTMFLGYAAAAGRLKKQLDEKEIPTDRSHPLIVYIPCGVGGAPSGITFGLKHEFGDDVYCVFSEPVQAPCMLLGMATGLYGGISVQDVGLDGRTAADGLAVGRTSGVFCGMMRELVSGIVTVKDGKLFDLMRDLWENDRIFIEPSACAAFQGAVMHRKMEHMFSTGMLTEEKLRNACHIVWATGGSMVPADQREEYIKRGVPNN